MLLSSNQQSVTMSLADHSTASALRAILAFQPGLALNDLDVRIEGCAITVGGSVSSEQARQRVLDIVHDFTAIPVVCLVSVRTAPDGLGDAGKVPN